MMPMEDEKVQAVEDAVRNEKKDKKNVQENLENLTDDEVYAHVQTEKLLKKKKTKKIVTIASLCLAFALAFVVIILAAVPVSLKPNCLLGNDLQTVTFYGKSNSQFTLEKGKTDDKAKFDKFSKYYDQSFDQTYLSALFSGSLTNYVPDETYVELKSPETTLKGDSYAGAGNYLVRFMFSKEHILKNSDGSKYKSRWGSALWDSYLSYKEVYFVVNKDAGLKDTKVFVVATYPTFADGVQTGTVQRLVTITVKADTSKLFNAWSEFTK